MDRYCLATFLYKHTHTRSRCCVLWLPRGVSSNVALWWLLYASWSWTLFIGKRWAEAWHQPPNPQLHLCRSSCQALMTSSSKCSKLRVPSYPGEGWHHSCPSLETSSHFICLQPWRPCMDLSRQIWVQLPARVVLADCGLKNDLESRLKCLFKAGLIINCFSALVV